MNATLQQFLDDCCHLHPAVSVPLRRFIRAFRTTLEPAEVRKWTRTRIIVELSKRFTIAGDARRGTMHILGVCLASALTVNNDGQLERAAN